MLGSESRDPGCSEPNLTMASQPLQSDAMCLCNSETFITNVAGCFGSQCSAADASAGVALGQQVSPGGMRPIDLAQWAFSSFQLCAAIGISVSIPAAASSALAGAGESSSSSAASSAAQTTTVRSCIALRILQSFTDRSSTPQSSGAAATSAPASAASAATSAAASAASSSAPTGAGFTLSANNALAGLAAVGAVLAAF